MSARSVVLRLAGAIAALAGAAGAAAQGAIESYHVQGNVHMLIGAGANVAVQVGDEGVLVVDTGATASREALLAAVMRASTFSCEMIAAGLPLTVMPACEIVSLPPV